MHHRRPNRERTPNLSLRKASGSGKVRVLSQIKPQTPRLVVFFRQCLQVPVLQLYSPQGPRPRGFPWGPSRPPPRRHRLGRGVKRSLIVVHPRAFALDQLGAAYRPPSRPQVPDGSPYFTCPRRIPPVPPRHLAPPYPAAPCPLSTPTSSGWHPPATSPSTAATQGKAPCDGITAAAGTMLSHK